MAYTGKKFAEATSGPDAAFEEKASSRFAQVVKIDIGAAGVDSPVTASNPLPVSPAAAYSTTFDAYSSGFRTDSFSAARRIVQSSMDAATANTLQGVNGQYAGGWPIGDGDLLVVYESNTTLAPVLFEIEVLSVDNTDTVNPIITAKGNFPVAVPAATLFEVYRRLRIPLSENDGSVSISGLVSVEDGHITATLDNPSALYAASASFSQVEVTTTGDQLAAADSARVGLTLFNTGAETVFIGYGFTPNTSEYSMQLRVGDYLEVPDKFCQVSVSGITTTAPVFVNVTMGAS